MGYVISIILLIMGLSILFSGEGKSGDSSNGKGNTDLYFYD